MLAKYWQHAAQIHALVARALICSCSASHRAHLWLQHSRNNDVELRLRVISNTSNRHTKWKVREVSIERDMSVTVRGAGRNEKIENLCATLGARHEIDACLGILENQGYDDTYLVFAEPSPARSSYSSPLTHLLDPSKKQVPPRLDRYVLALRLASAFPRHYLTPWFQTENKIRIPRNASGEFDCYTPYVLASFEQNNIHRPAPDSQKVPLEKIARTLLQLCSGKRLEDHEGWINTSKIANDESRHAAYLELLREWSRSALKESGPKYRSAIEWCLQQHNKLTVNDSWRHDFEQNIVKPLEMTCD